MRIARQIVLVSLLFTGWYSALHADVSCVYNKYLALNVEVLGTSGDQYAQVISQSGAEQELRLVFDTAYSQFLAKAVEMGDTRQAFESWSVVWNMNSEEIPAASLVPKAIFECASWMFK